MHWDIDKLKQIYNSLIYQYELESDISQKRIINNDICNISLLISFYDKKFIVNNEYIDNLSNDTKCHQYIKRHYRSILELLNRYSYIPINSCSGTQLNDYEYEQLIKEFFQQYQFLLFTTFINLKSDNRIEINNDQRFSDGFSSRGACSYCASINKSYVYAFFDNNTINSHFLPHELAHAAFASKFPDLKCFVKRIDSLFMETYPKYVELLFFDYLAKKGYPKDATYLKEMFWYHFIKTIKIHGDKRNYTETLQYIISSLTAMLLFEEYKKSHSNDIIRDFNKYYINHTDYQVIKDIGLKRILNGGRNYFLQK